MDYPSYLERWLWLGLTLLVLALLSPSAVLVGLALWLGLLWKARGWWRWVVAVCCSSAVVSPEESGTW